MAWWIQQGLDLSPSQSVRGSHLTNVPSLCAILRCHWKYITW